MEQIWKAISPLMTVNSPFDMYASAPCNIIFETEWIIFFFICTYHAFSNKNRLYLLSWLTTLISGVCLDLFTIYSKEISNFNQHKFTLMLLDSREPLYILFGLYYVSHLAIILAFNSRFNGSVIAQYSFCLLLSSYMYQQFDLLGTNFQFWSWHNSDPLVIDRNGGVPIASTMFFGCYSAGLFLMLRYLNTPNMSIFKCFLSSLVCAIGGNILMTVALSLTFHPIVTFGGFHSKYALYVLQLTALTVLLVSVCANNIWNIQINFSNKNGKSLHILVVSFVIICAVNGAMMYAIDPKSIKQSGYHQPLWNEQQTEISFWGVFERNKYVLIDDINVSRDYYNFDCLSNEERQEIDDYFESHKQGLTAEGLKWYTLCAVGLSEQWTFNYYIISFVSLFLIFCAQFLSFKAKRN